MIRSFARKENIPHDTCACPRSSLSNRRRMARIIGELEKVCPEVKTNIFRSVKRIKKEYLL